jgi:hypothetical protein
VNIRLGTNPAFVLLCLASIGSFLLFEERHAALATGIVIFAIGLAKVNLVFGHFMHLHFEHRPYRLVLTGWLAVVAAILAAGLFALP